jgi:polysaccharide biosynthesis/export protein
VLRSNAIRTTNQWLKIFGGIVGPCVALLVASGCSTVPGMHMPDPTKQTPSSSEQGAPFRFKDINAGLVEEQRSAAITADRQVAQQLLGAAPSGYVVGPGDVLQITVWDHPEIALGLGSQPATEPRPADPPPGIVVDDAGDIQFPYVGRLRVGGLSPGVIQARLTQRLAAYFVSPQVTVRMASYRSKEIFVDGEVHSPGVQQINDVPMTLMDAISRAGGFTSDADEGRVLLTRGGERYVVSLSGLVAAGYDPSSLYLRNRDLLRVPTRSENGIYVMGEVVKPVTAIPEPDGNLTLADALSQAGSLNVATSDPRQLYVVRKESGGAPLVFHLDARSPVAMVMANRFALRPGDVVYVGPTDLTVVYRVLSQLLPAIDAGLTGAVLTK